MRALFIVIAVLGLGYFLLRKRRFDFFSLGFLSSVVYFLPGFFGYVLMPPSALNPARTPADLLPQTYGVFLLVLTTILLGSMVYDLWSPKEVVPWRLPAQAWSLRALVVLAVVACAVTLMTAGSVLFSPDKSLVIAAIGRWRILWVAAASLGAVLAFLSRRWYWFLLLTVLLLFDLYVGFRNNTALTLIALFVVLLHRKGPQRVLLRNKVLAVFGALSAVSLFLFKYLYIPLKGGNYQLVLERATDPIFILKTIATSEPFGTQAILNEVLRERFQTGIAGLGELVYQVVLFAPQFGIETEAINDIFREGLFPDAPSGLGGNIWAEMWSRGGWGLLLLFLLVFIALLAVGSHALRLGDGLMLAGISLSMSYWAFYIHRNSIAFQLNLEKRVLLPWVFALGVGLLAEAFSRPRAVEASDVPG